MDEPTYRRFGGIAHRFPPVLSYTFTPSVESKLKQPASKTRCLAAGTGAHDLDLDPSPLCRLDIINTSKRKTHTRHPAPSQPIPTPLALKAGCALRLPLTSVPACPKLPRTTIIPAFFLAFSYKGCCSWHAMHCGVMHASTHSPS